MGRSTYVAAGRVPDVGATGPRCHDGLVSAGDGLLERSSHLSVLDEALTATLDGRGVVVLLDGEAGGGKTTLLRHFLATRQRTGPVLWGSCDPLFTPRPLAPFIDIAEETGDIVPMGQWILRESCRQTREWQLRLGLPLLQVSVNLSSRQFQEPDLVESIRQAIEDTGLPPSSLILEITESGLMARTAGTIGRLAELRALGVHLAIDDFGTGYSSLSYLERFPVDILKIDRSFIASVTASGERPAIARAIVELGRTLGLRVVAEGIEEPDQADWLVSLGCPLGQGYLFSRPLGVDAMEMFLATDATRRVQEGDTAERDVTSATPGRRRRRASSAPLRLVSGE